MREILHMIIIDMVINTLFGRVTRHPAGMHCPSWGDAFVSSCLLFSLRFTEYRLHCAICRPTVPNHDCMSSINAFSV